MTTRHRSANSFAFQSALLFAVVISNFGAAQTTAQTPAPRIKVVRKRETNPQAKLKQQAPQPQTPAASLSYYGGPVVSNIQVVVVLWGSGVNSTVTTQIGGFYTAVTKSSYYDLISEYSTSITPVGGGSGTNQSIGRGDYGGAYTIAPSVCPSGPCTVTDAQINTEILSQITAGHLPAPSLDGNGNVNTLYMTYFPPLVVITQGGSASCVAGGFCAYHGTTSSTFNSKHLLYGVMPDFGAGSGCDLGCGSGTEFENVTSVSSHEMVEAVTDADVGLATVFAPPLAWYDGNGGDQNGGGEIGDICNGQQAQITVAGTTYTVQKQWSNFEAACVAIGTHPSFQLTAPSSAASAAAFNFTVTAKNPVGSSTDISFVGTVHFTSSDPQAVLPADYAFTPADKGTQTFGATLKTSGSQTVSATDTINGAITGVATVTVNAATQAPAITSANGTTFIEGTAGTFTVTATGLPTPSLTKTGILPSGVTFVDNGNGAATLAGTPAVGSHGTYNLTIKAHNTASPDATQNFTLTVNAATRLLTVSPASLDFGDVNLSTPSQKVVTVTNTGTAAVAITRTWLTQDTNNDFSLSSTCNSSLAPGKTCSLTVTFNEPSQEADSAVLHITDNATGSPQRVTIKGHATNIQLSFSPASLSFAPTTVGSNASQSVTLTNTGSTSLRLNSFHVNGTNAADFTYTNHCPATLAASAQCTVDVKFAPSATVTRNAGLQVRANGGQTLQTLPLTGTGN